MDSLLRAVRGYTDSRLRPSLSSSPPTASLTAAIPPSITDPPGGPGSLRLGTRLAPSWDHSPTPLSGQTIRDSFQKRATSSPDASGYSFQCTDPLARHSTSLPTLWEARPSQISWTLTDFPFPYQVFLSPSSPTVAFKTHSALVGCFVPQPSQYNSLVATGRARTAAAPDGVNRAGKKRTSKAREHCQQSTQAIYSRLCTLEDDKEESNRANQDILYNHGSSASQQRNFDGCRTVGTDKRSSKLRPISYRDISQASETSIPDSLRLC